MKSRRTLALPQKCVDALRKLWALQLTCRRRDPWQEGAAEGGGYDVAGSVIPGQDREAMVTKPALCAFRALWCSVSAARPGGSGDNCRPSRAAT
jgi:hypothetical protein